MDLIDSHCHLNFDRYDDDRDAVLARAHKRGVSRIIIPAIDIPTARASLALAEQYTGIYVSVGLHPNSTSDFAPAIIDTLAELAAHPRVVAIGEIGLDYHWDKSPTTTQKRAFQAQLDLAKQLNLPVIIHNREASHDVLPMLEAWVLTLPDTQRENPGVLHSFSAPAEYAQRALSAGFYLGFTGPLTFKKADDLRQIAREVPLDRVLIETDGPFLTPEPYRGKRNEPAYVYYVADRLAALHDMTTAEMADQTTTNTERLFKLD